MMEMELQYRTNDTCHTESHPSPAKASRFAHEGSPQQENCLRSGHRQGGCWVRVLLRNRMEGTVGRELT